MAALEQITQAYADDDDEYAWETEDSESDSDDSEEDPAFDLVERTQSLSINEKHNRRAITKKEPDGGDKSDKENACTRADSKSSEQVEEIIHSEQVEKLKVDQLKAYLRRHALRLTGKKDVLIQRVKEHLEIMNGRGEEKYPPSSFVLNCKGDACMGDVVVFEQVIYKKRSKTTSISAIALPCKKRIVAGRIIKESYGSAKQQHTFTIEVLWSKGDKPLPPLHPLLIKGRNLYKLNTMRQRWEDEAERSKVLNEKHSRGSVARSNREARIQRKEAHKKLIKDNRDNNTNRHNKPFSVNAENVRNQGQLQTIQTCDKQHSRHNMIINQNNGQMRPRFPINKENTCPLPPSQAMNPRLPSFQTRYQGPKSWNHHYYPQNPATSTHPHSKTESFRNHHPPLLSFHQYRADSGSFHDQNRCVTSFNDRYQPPMPGHHRYHHKEPAVPPYLHSTMDNFAGSGSFRYENRQTGHGYGDVDAQRLQYRQNSGYHDHPERQYYPQSRFNQRT